MAKLKFGMVALCRLGKDLKNGKGIVWNIQIGAIRYLKGTIILAKSVDKKVVD